VVRIFELNRPHNLESRIYGPYDSPANRNALHLEYDNTVQTSRWLGGAKQVDPGRNRANTTTSLRSPHARRPRLRTERPPVTAKVSR